MTISRWWRFILTGVLLCGMHSEAQAVIGVGARGGVQVKGGTYGIAGAHLDLSPLPLIHMRPNVEIGKKDNQTITNPNLDFSININPTGIGPKPYIGAGVGVIRRSLPVGPTTVTSNKANVNVLGGIQTRLAPFLSGFIEVKGVFSQGSNTSRLLVGITLSL